MSSQYSFLKKIDERKEQIPITSSGAWGEGGVRDIADNLLNLRTYLDIIEGGENAGEPLGERKWIKAGGLMCAPSANDIEGKSLDTLSGEDADKWAGCITTPSGEIHCPSWIFFNTTEGGGVAGGLLGSTEKLLQKANPMKIAEQMTMDDTPTCRWADLIVSGGLEGHFITDSNLSDIDACYTKEGVKNCNDASRNYLGIGWPGTYRWENGQRRSIDSGSEAFSTITQENALQKMYNVGLTVFMAYFLIKLLKRLYTRTT